MSKAITKKDAKKVLAIVDEAGGFDCVEEYMQELAQDAYKHIEKVRKNKKHLTLLIKGMLLPKLRNFTSATKT